MAQVWSNLLESLFRTISSAALIRGPWVSKLMPKLNKVVFFPKEFTIFCSTWLPIIADYKKNSNWQSLLFYEMKVYWVQSQQDIKHIKCLKTNQKEWFTFVFGIRVSVFMIIKADFLLTNNSWDSNAWSFVREWLLKHTLWNKYHDWKW